MIEACTCGARTVEGARFCHKCGRPLYPEVLPEPEEEAPPLPVEVVAAPKAENPAEISFRNAVAVRVGFLVAGLGIFATNLTALLRSGSLQFFALLGLSMASGVFAVWLYMRRTGHTLSVRGGARLGWITGVLSFLILIVIMTLTLAMVGPDKLSEVFRDPAVTGGIPPAEIERLLESPTAIAAALAFTLAVVFGAYTVAASVGGAVGAKLLHKDGDSA